MPVIGKPVEEVPQSSYRYKYDGEWLDIITSLEQAPKGSWVPIEIEHIHSATKFASSARAFKPRKLEVKQRKNVIYLRLMEAQ